MQKEARPDQFNLWMKEQIFQARFGMEGDELRAATPMRVDDPLPGQRLNRGLFTSLTPEWPTPDGVFQALNDAYHFMLDACATSGNAKCERYFTTEQDALRQEWTGTIWLNPPYGREIGAWLRKAAESATRGATVVCLVPSRTDTDWWHRVRPVTRDQIHVTGVTGREEYL